MIEEAIILAGGRGTRLQSVVPALPKPMAPVAGKPFLEILLAFLAAQGLKRIILSVGFRAEYIVAHFGDNFYGMEIDYAKEDSPLGTGGALRLSLQMCRQEAALILNGDTFLECDLNNISLDWETYRLPMLVGVRMRDTKRYGRLLLEGERPVGFLEKTDNSPGIINAGSYLFPTDIFRGRELPDAFSLEHDFLAQEVCRAPFRLFTVSGLFIDIGVPEDYLKAQTYLEKYAR